MLLELSKPSRSRKAAGVDVNSAMVYRCIVPSLWEREYGRLILLGLRRLKYTHSMLDAVRRH